MADSGTSAPSRLNALLASGTTLVAIVASLVNVWLTVQSQQIQKEVQKREEELQNLESEIKRGQAALEQSKERTERYRFVQGLLPDLIGADAQRQVLTINVIRLTLTEEEAERLFAGFARSGDAELQKAGEVAIADIQVERTQRSSARELERSGFENLIAGRYDAAVADFAEAEKTYPTYHNVAEISLLLRQEQRNLSNPEARQQVLGTILKQYSWGMEEDIQAQLRDKARGGG
jgi:hypothetical protein